MKEISTNSNGKRTCIKCNIAKPLTEFFFDNRSGHFQNICLECYKKYHQEYYEKRKAQNINKAPENVPSEVKTCIKCGVEKPISEFSFDKANGKYINTCKSCKVNLSRKNYEKNKEKRLLYAKSYALNNKERIKTYRKKYYEEHAERAKTYSREYNKEHWDEVSKKRRVYRQLHREEFRKRDKEYAIAHKEQIVERYRRWAREHAEQLAEYNRQYREKNADRISEQRRIKDRENRPRINAYIKQKRLTDPLFTLSCNVRGLIRASLKNRGYSKKTSTYEILGCDYETLMQHLKQTWLDNYGSEWHGEDYHIDHIIPLATAQSEEEVLDLCYYKNLQMLKPRDNLVKNKRLDWKIPD